jgi:hypothetical protein
VLAAVQQNGEALEYASPELRGDREVVLAAVYSCGDALQFTSEEFKNNRQFLIECYRNNKNSIQFNEFIKEFDNLENEIYNNNIFMKENADILNLVNNNREQLYNYLFKNNKYDIIYGNEDIAEYIRDNNKIVIFSLNDIKPISNHDIEEVIEEVIEEETEVVTEEEIKQTYSNTLLKMDPKLTPIFID